MTWLTPFFLINIALTFNPVEPIIIDKGIYLPNQIVSTEITTGAKIFDLVSIEGQTNIYGIPPWISDNNSFNPFQTEFYFRAYVSKFGASIGVERLCTHLINPECNTTRKRHGSSSLFLLYEWEGKL